MAGRPKKEDSRDKQYRVRLNEEENLMLDFCSEETGEAKSEIFRKALKAYYENIKYIQNVRPHEPSEYDMHEYDANDLDHISLKRSIVCPYCGARNAVDFADDCDTYEEERQMGPEITYSFEWEKFVCDDCAEAFKIYGYISEYPVGAYNFEEIYVEPDPDVEVI